MNRIKSLFLFSVATLCLCGCYDEVQNEINALNRRITALETACDKLNANVASLRSVVNAIEGYDFVKNVKTIEDSDGKAIGYTISFTHSNPISIFNGKSEETPVIGVRKADDGLYYWTVTYESTGTTDLLDDKGAPVPATSYTPIFRIVDEKWQISYDGGEVWRSDYEGKEFGRATGETPKSWFSSVVDSTDYVIFNFTDGSVVRVPTWSTYEKLCKDAEAANRNYSQMMSLFDALKAKLYAKSLTPIISGTDTVGYTLTLSDNSQMTFYNGVSTNRPELSASLDPSDSAFYWTIKYKGEEQAQWLTHSGQKLRANANDGITPKLAIYRDTTNSSDLNYYWMISYYESMGYFYLTSENGNKVQASVSGSVSDQIKVTNEFVGIKIGENYYQISRYQDFEVKIDSSEITMSASDTTSFSFEISNGDSEFAVLPIAEDGFFAETTPKENGKSWIVEIISPATFTEGSSKLTLLISDGRGHMKTYFINIKFGGE